MQQLKITFRGTRNTAIVDINDNGSISSINWETGPKTTPIPIEHGKGIEVTSSHAIRFLTTGVIENGRLHRMKTIKKGIAISLEKGMAKKGVP